MGQLQPVTVDLETYYTTVANGGYTLSRMTTEEYVRDPRFEIIGVSLKFGDAPSQYYTGDLEYIKAVLRQVDWANTMAIGHNKSEFDSFILTQVVGVRPRAYACTLQLARALHGSKDSGGKNIANGLGPLCQMYGLAPKGNQVANYVNYRRADFTPEEMADYGEYCGNKAVTGKDGDTDLCWELFKLFAPQVPANELRIASLSTRMFAEPRLELDLPLLEALQRDMAIRKGELLGRVAGILGIAADLPLETRLAQAQSMLRKDQILANVLQNQYDIDPPTKLSPKRKDANGDPLRVYAFAKTDEGMSELLDYEDESDPLGAEDIQALAAARLGVKSTLAESRVERFVGIARRGPLPVPLAFGKTGTHRLAGCLVAETKITCYDPDQGVCEKSIVDVLPDDLVWDGEEFVEHGGVKFQGYAEVIEHDGITGTACHPVFTTPGSDATLSLAEAAERGAGILACEPPPPELVDGLGRGAARRAGILVPLSLRLRG